jgi:hypothetical protein
MPRTSRRSSILTVREPPPPAVEQPVPDRITIADAVKVFLGNREGARIAPVTLRKYRTFTKQLSAFTDSRGYVMLDQFASGDIDVFYGGWTLRRSAIAAGNTYRASSKPA